MQTFQYIQDYLQSLPESKRSDLVFLHERLMQLFPAAQLWFLDGKDEDGKMIANPNIGYGHQILHYANGTTRAFYQIGLSANTAGISVYILGMKDKQYLRNQYSESLGKARITSYCIQFSALKNINIDILERAFHDGMGQAV